MYKNKILGILYFFILILGIALVDISKKQKSINKCTYSVNSIKYPFDSVEYIYDSIKYHSDTICTIENKYKNTVEEKYKKKDEFYKFSIVFILYRLLIFFY